MKHLSCLFLFLFLALSLSSAVATNIFSLADLPTDSEQARTRLSHLKNANFISLIPREPAYLVLVAPNFWKKLSINEKAGVIRDLLYFCRFYNQANGTNFGGTILFNMKNPKQEYGYGNLKPGQIIIF